MKEVSHKRPHITWPLLYEICRISKSIATESRLLVAQGYGQGRGVDGEWPLTSTKDDENILKLGYNNYCTILKYAKNNWILHLNRWTLCIYIVSQ